MPRNGANALQFGAFAMNSTLRFLQIFALGAWVGSIFYFSAITPGLFRVIPNQDLTGLVVEFAIARLHTLGVVAGLLFIFASAILATASAGAAKRLALPAAGVTLMIVLTVFSQHVVIRRMAQLRREMVSVVATPGSDPRRVEFDKLHGESVDLEGAVLLLGFASLFLTVWNES
jgi:Domain of unknown function (DUF4149)